MVENLMLERMIEFGHVLRGDVENTFVCSTREAARVLQLTRTVRLI
jgi:hypothetical protein